MPMLDRLVAFLREPGMWIFVLIFVLGALALWWLIVSQASAAVVQICDNPRAHAWPDITKEMTSNGLTRDRAALGGRRSTAAPFQRLPRVVPITRGRS